MRGMPVYRAPARAVALGPSCVMEHSDVASELFVYCSEDGAVGALSSMGWAHRYLTLLGPVADVRQEDLRPEDTEAFHDTCGLLRRGSLCPQLPVHPAGVLRKRER